MLTGGLAGSSWLITYPIDAIKTRVQNGMSYPQTINCRRYFNGLNACILRSYCKCNTFLFI